MSSNAADSFAAAPAKSPALARYWPDLAIMAVLAAGMAILTFQTASRLPEALLLDPAANDAWFEADTPRVVQTMATYPGKFGLRYFLHPLHSEWTYPIVAFVSLVMGNDLVGAVMNVTSAAAATWVAMLYVLLRAIGCRRLDAALFSLLGGTTAAAIAWFAVPETHAWGSLSVMAALLVGAMAARQPVAARWQVLVHVMTMSFTITNWLAAIAVSAVYCTRRRLITITATAAAIVAGLSILEPVLRKASQQAWPLPSSVTVLLTTAIGVVLGVAAWRMSRRDTGRRLLERAERVAEQRWVLGLVSLAALGAVIAATAIELPFIANAHRGSPLRAATAFAFHSVAMPTVQAIDRYGRGWPTLSVQASLPGDAGAWSMAAVVLWTALLAAGLIAMIRLDRLHRFRAAVGIGLAGQLVLHLLYGDETFLYAMNWLPLLLVIPAMATLTRFRPAILLLTTAAIVAFAVNNLHQFHQAAQLLQ